MSQLQLLGVEKMKYKRDGGGYRCDRRMLPTPPLPRDCIIKLKLLKQNYYSTRVILLNAQVRNDDMTIKFPGFPQRFAIKRN